MLLYRVLTAVLMWPAGFFLRRHTNFAGTISRRLGLTLPDRPGEGPAVWVHAASLGEVKAAAGLIRAMKKAYPGTAILLSAMTATGRQVANSIPELDLVFPLPFDAGWVMRRYLTHLRPKALFVVETELWPCMISEARSFGIPVVVVNGRMTE
jgi:3-deoxy-D-manno-octulosonic-acid transferase